MRESASFFSQGPAGVARGLFRLFASYGMAVVVLFLLLVLTLLGTLEQAEHGLWAVQKKYFDSVFLVHHLFGRVPIPLPGVYLLMTLLFVNLLCGAIIRAPKSWRAPGMLIAHGGILLLLLGGFVTFHFSTDGMLQLYEDESSDVFKSYHEWVVEVRQVEPAPSEQVWIVPLQRLERGGARAVRRVTAPEWPFTLALSGFQPHSRPLLQAAPLHRRVDGVALHALPREPEQEFNVPGLYVDVVPAAGAAVPAEGILWGLERHPLAVAVGDARWTVGLARRQWQMPFTVRLDTFTVEHHPNTAIARTYRSDITRFEDGHEEQIRISMNAPMRHRGYTLFQATWGPQNAPPGTPLFSGFAVVRNPADQWPLIACIVVGVGLLIHLLQRLIRQVRRGAV